jgi:cysteine desulfurase / selenocysteine lyase
MTKPRSDFPLLCSGIVYLDSAATTQKPQLVIDAVSNYYATANANIHRGIYSLSETSTSLYEEAREKVSNFIGATVNEIIFTSGTTDSINKLAEMIGLLLGDRKEIVVTVLEHHSNLVPWQQLAKRIGGVIKCIPIKEDLTLDYTEAEKLIGQDTAVVACTHLSNTTGTLVDVKKICSLARSAGALTCIDAAQSIAHLPINVKEIGCDFLAFSGHKIYGPTGIGILYGREKLLSSLEPSHTGGGMVEVVSINTSTWQQGTSKFEAGTPPIAQAIGLGIAIDYYSKIKLSPSEKLLDYLVEQLRSVNSITTYSPPSSHHKALVSFTMRGVHPHDVAAILAEDGVCVRAGHHCTMPLMKKLGVVATVRASIGVYTTKEDIDKLITSVKRAHEVFCG